MFLSLLTVYLLYGANCVIKATLLFVCKFPSPKPKRLQDMGIGFCGNHGQPAESCVEQDGLIEENES